MLVCWRRWLREGDPQLAALRTGPRQSGAPRPLPCAGMSPPTAIPHTVELLSRTQPWESNVLLTPYGWLVWMTEPSKGLCINFHDAGSWVRKSTHLAATGQAFQVPLVIKPATYQSEVVCLFLQPLFALCVCGGGGLFCQLTEYGELRQERIWGKLVKLYEYSLPFSYSWAMCGWK